MVEGQTEPTLQGWYCGGALRPVPAPCVAFRQQGPLPQLFQTVLWPQRPGETALPRTESLGGGWMRVALPGGGWDIHCAPRRAGFYRMGEWRFFGAGFWARQGPVGDIVAQETIEGG